MLYHKKYFLIFSIIFLLLAVSLVSAGYSGKLTVSKTSGGKIIITGPGQMPTYYCGDGMLQSFIGEQCDSSNLGGETCVSLGYDSGVLSCKSNCVFDTTECANNNGGSNTGGTTGGSSSSGGGSSCVENWQCEDWGECEDGKQTRTCKDIKKCGTKKIKPDIERICSAEGLIGDEALKMLNESVEGQGFFSRITGAVIGGGKGGFLVPLLFIIVIIGLLIITLAFKKKVISKQDSSEDVGVEDVDKGEE